MSTQEETSRYYTEFAGVGYDAPEGGFVAVREGGTATAIGAIKQAPEGWALGPLQIDAPVGHRVVLDTFEYREPASRSFFDGLLSQLPLAGLTLPALAEKHNPPEEQETVSRRDVVKAGVVALGGAAVVESVRAASSPSTLTVAELSVYENNAGLGLQLWDGVEGVLPNDMEYTVLVDGEPIDSFGVDSTAVVPPRTTGTVTVETSESLSILQSLDWSVSGHQPISFEFELGKQAGVYDAGTELVLSRQALVTDPLSAVGGDGVVVTLGETSVPHRTETSSSVGEYFVRDDGALVYKTGRSAPDAATVAVTVQADRIEELQDDIQRKW